MTNSPYIQDQLCAQAPYTCWCAEICGACEGTGLSEEDEVCYECDHIKRPKGSACEYCTEGHPGQNWQHWAEYKMTAKDVSHDMNLMADAVLGQKPFYEYLKEGLDSEVAYRKLAFEESKTKWSRK
jgi:hypothetical protein